MKDRIAGIAMLSLATGLIHAGTPALRELDVRLAVPNRTACLDLPGQGSSTGCGLVDALASVETTLEQK